MHLWEQWNARDWTTYREVRPRFVAEFGWQGPPAWSTLTRSVSDDPLTPESPGMLVHQKALDGNVKLTSGLLPHYRVPDDMETWHWAMQLNQANAVSCALDWFRSLAPHTSGAVVWQLNDCWPVTSWAAVDGDGREKPLWFALRNAFAPRVVTVQPAGDGLRAVLGNDTDDAWEGEVVLTRRRFDGTVLATARMPVTVAARGSLSLDVPPDVAGFEHPAGELVVAEGLGTRGLWFPAEPRRSELPPPVLRVDGVRGGEGDRGDRDRAGAAARRHAPRRQGAPRRHGRPGAGHAAARRVDDLPGALRAAARRGGADRARHPALRQRAGHAGRRPARE